MSALTKLARAQLREKSKLKKRGNSTKPRSENPLVLQAALVHLLRNPRQYLGGVVSGVDLAALARFSRNILPLFAPQPTSPPSQEILDRRNAIVLQVLGAPAMPPAAQPQPRVELGVSIE